MPLTAHGKKHGLYGNGVVEPDYSRGPIHTPGPWQASGVRCRIAGTCEFLQITGGPKDAVIAYVPYSGLRPRDHLESHGDQKMLAASLAMFEAIEAVIVNGRDVDGSADVAISRELFNDLSAAYVRAGGRNGGPDAG